MSNLKELRDSLRDVMSAGRAAVDAYAGRDPTDDEIGEVSRLLGERERIEGQVFDAERRADAERAFAGRDSNTVTITGGEPRMLQDPRRGFKHFGEFAMAVHSSAAPSSATDERLRIGAAPTTYSSGNVGADGGYLIPPEFSENILSLALGDSSALRRSNPLPLSGNSLTVGVTEATPWGSVGVQIYWKAQAAQATQSKLALKEKTLRLQTMIALVPMTTELEQDATAAGALVTDQVGAAILWTGNDALINGNGAGQPMGVLNAGSLVTVAKEGSQTADTISSANVGKMYGACLNPANATWHIAPDAFNQLITMSISNAPVWTSPDRGLQDAPNGRLLGLPVVIDHSCQTLGDLGDIYLINWADGYLSAVKAGQEVQTDISIHLWFDYATDAFRAIFRVDGQPWLSSAVAAAYGSSTYSHCVTLAARA